ncbi:hypothetical protein [Pelagibius sp. Alg239-R121]|uniref:CC0125/CC1285 family lipoprotein n=1 Tax=Pelagibius sp. Alg239-R121 TaxID=2993448 RepID=UPI0024A77C71|nr:hypothetical protein [Pelagibius sp. Alg239-R121]
MFRLLRGLSKVAALFIAALVYGCTTPTPYAPALDGKGYSQQQTQSDRYRVSFSGNSKTSRETVENYLLYRAAEITVQSGHDHFRVVAQDLESTTTYYETVTPPPSFGYYGRYGRRSLRHRHHSHGFHGFPYATYPYGQFATVTSHPITSYEAVANIIVFSKADGVDRKAIDDDHTYDARDVIQQLSPIVVRPDAKAE